MGQVPVVSERQFEGGEKLIRELVAGGLVLTGACWAKLPERGKGYLYLISPDAIGAGGRSMSRRVFDALATLDARKAWGHWLERVDGLDVLTVSPLHAIGMALAGVYDKYVGEYPTIRSDMLGPLPIDGAAMIYPPAMFAQPAPAAG